MGEEVEVGHTPFFRRPKEFTTTLARNIITDFTMVWVPNVYFIAVHVGTNVRGSQKKCCQVAIWGLFWAGWSRLSVLSDRKSQETSEKREDCWDIENLPRITRCFCCRENEVSWFKYFGFDWIVCIHRQDLVWLIGVSGNTKWIQRWTVLAAR